MGGGDSSSAPEKHAGFCLKSRVCGYSAVFHRGISSVQLLLPSLETVFPGWVFVTQFPPSLFPPEYNSPFFQLHSQFVAPPPHSCALFICSLSLSKHWKGHAWPGGERPVCTCSAARCQGCDDCRRVLPGWVVGRIGVQEVDCPQLRSRMKWGTGSTAYSCH